MSFNPQNPNGQATSANSQPVVLASDQSSIPVASTLQAETTKVIGTVNIASAQTIANVTSITNALPAGTNLIGKVGIDQTTPGTTNRVDVGTINSVAPAFGTGVRGATVQRVTIATDDSVPVTGPLTDTQLRATAVPVSGTVSTGGLTDTQLRATAVPVSGTVGLSTGSNAIGGITGAGSNGQIKDDTFYGDGVTSGLFATATRLWNGTSYDRLKGDVTNGAFVNVKSITPPTLTKGTQGATGYTVQSLNDAGRNLITYYSVIPVLASATDTLYSLTGTKSGATVTATTTPAVVTTGKTLRITRFSATYIATATSGYAIARLRFNTAGVVAITSPVAAALAVAAGTPATANSGASEDASIADGKEFAAGTGIGISVQGFSAATATAVGYMFVSVSGYEY